MWLVVFSTLKRKMFSYSCYCALGLRKLLHFCKYFSNTLIVSCTFGGTERILGGFWLHLAEMNGVFCH